MSVELQGTTGPSDPAGHGFCVCSEQPCVPAEGGCLYTASGFLQPQKKPRSFQHLCHSRVLSLLLLFLGNLKTNYKRKNNNLQVFVRLHIKGSVSLTHTFSTHIFLCIIICIASGLPFLKY